jgi:hypothetical protein
MRAPAPLPPVAPLPSISPLTLPMPSLCLYRLSGFQVRVLKNMFYMRCHVMRGCLFMLLLIFDIDLSNCVEYR